LKTPFKWQINENWFLNGNHSLTYEGVWREVISSLDSAFSVREQSGHSLKSSFKYTNEIDRRDKKVLPMNGSQLKTTIELAGLGGDIKFFKFNSDYQTTATFFKHFVRLFMIYVELLSLFLNLYL